jgi:invasin D
MNISDDQMMKFRIGIPCNADGNSLSAEWVKTATSGSDGPVNVYAESTAATYFPSIDTAFSKSRIGDFRNAVMEKNDAYGTSNNARNSVLRVLSTVAQGKRANVGLAMQRYAASQTAAVGKVKANLTCLQTNKAPVTEESHALLQSSDATSNTQQKSDDSSKPVLKAAAQSASQDPDTSTPAAVDAITINNLTDLKAYYADYAADYAALAAFVVANATTDPDACTTQTQAFADKYSAPIIINAGIDPAYAQTALGNTWNVTDITLPGKGTFQAYRVNLSAVQDYIDDQAFCGRLKSDLHLAGLIWLASAGEMRAKTDAEPTYRQVQAALQALEASFQVPSHVSVLPDSLPDFYQATPDAAGGYWITPSKKYAGIISDCDAYLKEWYDHYGHTPSDDEHWNQDTTTNPHPEAATKAYGDAGDWLAQSIDNSAWMADITKYSIQTFSEWQPDADTFDAELDSLVRSDAAQYGGLKTTISEAKAAIIDPYGSLVDEYMNYTQSVTDIVAALSNYVKASGDGSKVTFQASDFKAKIDAEISQLSGWSLTIPGTSILSNNDWGKELSGNFIATKNADGTTTLKLDLSNLQGMSSSLSNYSNGDISVTQYNAWYSGFTSQKDNVQNLSQSIAEKFSKMNTTFDDLVRVMSATISALLESEAKYFQF